MSTIVDQLRKAIAKETRTRRQARGLTQAALAEEIDVSVEMVSRLERGRCFPSVPTLVALARALGTTPDELLSFPRPKHSRELQRAIEAFAAKHNVFWLVHNVRLSGWWISDTCVL